MPRCTALRLSLHTTRYVPQHDLENPCVEGELVAKPGKRSAARIPCARVVEAWLARLSAFLVNTCSLDEVHSASAFS